MLASPHPHFHAVAIPEIFLVARCSGRYVDTSVYDVYCAIMTSKELIALLNKDGWTLRGSKGSHHVFVHASKAGHLTVPHPKKDLGTGPVQKILKQAGLK